LLRRNQTSCLLLRLLVELLDFLLLLLWRKGRIAAHGLNLAVRVLFDLFTLLHRRLRDACLLPAGLLVRWSGFAG